MSYIKKVHGKLGQHVSISLLFGLRPPCCATPPWSPPSCAPTRNTAGHDNMIKSIHGFPLFPYMGMGLRLAALRAAGAPLLGQRATLALWWVLGVFSLTIDNHYMKKTSRIFLPITKAMQISKKNEISYSLRTHLSLLLNFFSCCFPKKAQLWRSVR